MSEGRPLSKPARPSDTFWRGRRVLVTGHTGFKGAWLALWLERLGAEVHGLALAPEGEPSLSARLRPAADGLGDLRDAAFVRSRVAAARPEIVLHLAAEAIVRRAYRDPAACFATNVMGTVNLLEALRDAPGLHAVVVATTDKVYRNPDDGRAFGEDDPLGGEDPYSASKAAAEIAVASWRRTVFEPEGVGVATARAGNVVGGGDWSLDRLVPDLWRAALARSPIELRHPQATRPWQHVLDALNGYLLLAERLAEFPSTGPAEAPAALNFGPGEGEAETVAAVSDAFARALGQSQGWRPQPGPHPPEKRHLSLDSSRARSVLGWRPLLDREATLGWTVDWYRAFADGADARRLCLDQLDAFGRLP